MTSRGCAALLTLALVMVPLRGTGGPTGGSPAKLWPLKSSRWVKCEGMANSEKLWVSGFVVLDLLLSLGDSPLPIRACLHPPFRRCAASRWPSFGSGAESPRRPDKLPWCGFSPQPGVDMIPVEGGVAPDAAPL